MLLVQDRCCRAIGGMRRKWKSFATGRLCDQVLEYLASTDATVVASLISSRRCCLSWTIVAPLNALAGIFRVPTAMFDLPRILPQHYSPSGNKGRDDDALSTLLGRDACLSTGQENTCRECCPCTAVYHTTTSVAPSSPIHQSFAVAPSLESSRLSFFLTALPLSLPPSQDPPQRNRRHTGRSSLLAQPLFSLASAAYRPRALSSVPYCRVRAALLPPKI